MLETLTAIIFLSAIVFVAMTGKRSDDEDKDSNSHVQDSKK